MCECCEAMKKCLQTILAQETEYPNATVKRIIRIARTGIMEFHFGAYATGEDDRFGQKEA